MRVPFSWLKEWVPTEASAEEIAELLTRGGLEVEGVEEAYYFLGPVKAVEILSVTPHPEEEKLKVCEVTDGQERYTIVSRAPGLKPGLRVALALPGAITFSGQKISETRIRGVLSQGMFLSPYEAGVSEEKDRLLELSPETPLGSPFYEGLDPEPVLEVAITPNRGDCLSILGVAREVAALTGEKLVFPEMPELPVEADLAAEAPVEILDPSGCFRYAGRLIRGVQVKESPFWLAKRLWMGGLRPINNLVDVTNYVLLELGQPLHAFDWEKIAGGKILVRRAQEGERITTLDGEERVLSPSMLVIADVEKPVALAGIMGGEASAVSSETQEVFLESAWFEPLTIRRTAKALKLSTDSSYRFERGIDPEGVPRALDYAAHLMVKLAGGEVYPGRVDLYPRPWKPQRIALRPAKLERYLQVKLEPQEVQSYLEKIGGEVDFKEGQWIFSSPSHRYDLALEEDLIEEIARLYGYDRLPTRMPRAELTVQAPDREDLFQKRLKEVFWALGFREVITYSFISPQSLKALELSPEDPRNRTLRLANPLSETQSVMRTTLIPGLLETARFNYFREIKRLKIFEIGKVFFPRPEGLPEEPLQVGFLLLGEAFPENWSVSPRPFDIYDLKGLWESLLQVLRLTEVELEPGSGEPFLKGGVSYTLKARGRPLGFMGEIKNYLRHQFELPEPVLVGEINLSRLLELPERPKVFKELPRYPATSRDLTLIVREDLPVGEIVKYLEGLKWPYLEEILVVDVYKGHPIPPGEKSVTVRLVYRSLERTLKDEEVNAWQESLVPQLLERFEARLR